MFDKDHTMLHIFTKAGQVWKKKYRKEKLYVLCLLPGRVVHC